jgi:hypothetical protein
MRNKPSRIVLCLESCKVASHHLLSHHICLWRMIHVYDSVLLFFVGIQVGIPERNLPLRRIKNKGSWLCQNLVANAKVSSRLSHTAKS